MKDIGLVRWRREDAPAERRWDGEKEYMFLVGWKEILISQRARRGGGLVAAVCF
jgi:hypothetical protein